MSYSNEELITMMQNAARNPMSLARLVVEDLEARVEGGVELSNPLNPAVHAYDMMSSLAAAGIRTNKALNRRHYPGAANNFEDTYHHMSDADYIDIFAAPAETTMTLLYQKEELISRMVDTGSGGVRKLTIGRHTKWTVGGMDFGILYPIDIRLMTHGNFQIVYDGSVDNPMGALESNNVNWAIRNLGRIGGGEMVEIQVPVKQFKRTSYKATLTGTAQFSKEYQFADQYYHCRAYMATRTGEWKEIRTTHSDQIFDPLTPTLQLKLLEGQLRVTLPYVYYSTGMGDTELRIDIYSTKGPLEMSMTSYPPNSFEMRYDDADFPQNKRFITPLTNFSTSTCYNSEMLIGGSNAITLEELKTRIKNNSVGRNTVPVTPAQIITELNKLGFGAVLNIDNVTERVYLATRKLPVPRDVLGEQTDQLATSSAGATMMMLTSQLDKLAGVPGIVDNGLRMTLSPQTLFRNKDGVLELVGQDELDLIRSLSLDALAARINSNSYLYSPLHYVLDISTGKFTTRPYYFGQPTTSSRNFQDDNDTTGIGVNSSLMSVTRLEDGTGWRMLIETSTDESYKKLPDEKVHLQIGVEDAEGSGMVYMDGRYIGRAANNERVFEFIITTNWDVNDQHHITTTSFDMLDGPQDYPIDLNAKFHLFYLAEDVRGFNYRVKWFDNMVGKFLYENEVSGLYYETINVKFGDNLDGLWTRSRSVPGTQEYERYEEDVYDYYPEDIFEIDPETQMRKIVINDGVMDFVYLHHKGDPVLDENESHRLLHAAGTVRFDVYNNPIVVSDRKVVQQTDLFLVDANYYFVTNEMDVQYAQRLPETLVMWIANYLRPFHTRSHNQTRVYLHPQTTVGHVKLMVGSGREIQIESAQELYVELHVRSGVYKDLNVRRSIENTIKRSISATLDREVVSLDSMLATVRALIGDDIISISINGLGGDSGYSTFTALDGGGRMCIGKRLTLGAEGNLTVADAITFSFVNHAD